MFVPSSGLSSDQKGQWQVKLRELAQIGMILAQMYHQEWCVLVLLLVWLYLLVTSQ
jgi:hypothetical protein